MPPLPAPPRLRVRSLPVDVTGDLLTRVPDEVDPREVVTWLREGDGMVGWGRAAVARTRGADRFSSAEEWWDRLREDAEVEDEVRAAGSGLVAFGSFAFSAGSGDDSVLTVPRVLIGRRDGMAWVTHVVVGDEPWPEDHPAEMLARTNPRLGELDPLVEGRGTVPAARWPEVIGRAIDRIGAGDVEKVVLARDVSVRHRDGQVVRVAPVLERLERRYAATWTFAVDGLLGATPEMLVRLQDGRVRSRVLAGTIRWRGSPISIDMATLDGTVRMDVRNGRVTKIDPGAARLINLFSLQALSRLGANPGRGFGFDRVGGTLRINNGIVQTDDTEVIGTTMADVKVNGQASLLDQTLDLDVLVQPKIDLGSTALIAAAVNPAIGLGTYFAQLLLSESINAAATQVLHISGPWNKPQVDTLKGEVASETARRILLSHATPGPVDPLWDWWPVTGSSLMWDWWPVTGQGSNYFGAYSVPPTVPLRALPADAPEAAAASGPAAAEAESMAPAAAPSAPLAPEAPGTPAPETGILPATRPSAPVSEPELVH